jgi:uncharacterized protein (TIGR03790 family)
MKDWRLWLCLACSVAGPHSSRGADLPLAASTVVIYNKASAESTDLARFYAKQRGISRDHLVALACSTDEEIDRVEYETAIARPLQDVFRQRGWWKYRTTAQGEEKVETSSIQFAAVMKGMPLKIRPVAAPFPGDHPGPGPIGDHNEASVDSELAVLPLGSKQISGAMTNPYFQSYRNIREIDNTILLLVCRLDAPNAGVVKRMILDGLAAERNGLWGRAYVDGSHGAAPGAAIGDGWMAEIPRQLHKVGVPVVYDDSPGVFPPGYPMTNCALYYGWYAGSAVGPFAEPQFHFAQGAIAVHIHSFSAATLRDPNANWVGPLLMRGATATLGNVYEPFLQLTTHLDILNDRLLHGFTFAESAYMATQALSWMGVMVGDPLYRPYASWLQIDAGSRDSGRPTVWKAYHEFVVKNSSKSPVELRNLERQFAARTANPAMLEDLGGMDAVEGNLAGATNYYQQARASYNSRDDILRVVIEECDALVKQGKSKRALDLVHSVLPIVTGAPAEPLLHQLERSLTSPPAPPAPMR